jgi:hypothetical protein
VNNHTKTQSRPAVTNRPNADLRRKRKREAYDGTITGRVESASKAQKVDDIVLGTLAYMPCDRQSGAWDQQWSGSCNGG